MEVKMESEQSYSGESSSSSDSSGGSSEGEEETAESVRILGHTLELPQELCEDYTVFKEFFSIKTWEALSDEHKEHLKGLLPKFPVNDSDEKEKTIQMLFNHEPFHFSSPLDEFHNNLRQGNYRPDIAKMRKFLKRARAKQQRHRVKSYYAKLLPEVLLSRERLLAIVKGAPPGPIPRLPLLPSKQSKNNLRPAHVRARHRYFEELSAIRNEVGGNVSEDENYPDGSEPAIKKRKQSSRQHDRSISGTLGSLDPAQPTSMECFRNILAAHRARRQYRDNHPELNTTGITLEDIKQRVALMNGAKKLMFGGPKTETSAPKLKRGPKPKDPSGKKADTKTKKKSETESVESKPLLPNIKIKCEQDGSDSESSSFVDQVVSPKQAKKSYDHVEIKQEVDVYPNGANANNLVPKLETVIKQEPQETPAANAQRPAQHMPIKLEDLEGIDMMALPIQLADESGAVVASGTTEGDAALTETTYANFMSLVRALFRPREAHRASKKQLYARCAAVMKSPIAPLNTWYHLSEDWCAELDSALDFLAGERGIHPDDFVPYLQFMPETQMYQWIGAGRDGDAPLGRLCDRWLRAAQPPPPDLPPPPRCPTVWSVRAPSAQELADFRAQERRRFAAAAKPFTYVQHGYSSVVGPAARGAGCGGGALLLAGRPRAAQLPALVRDAVARLPNGEGTRMDVLTMLRMSQYLAPCSEQALVSALSATLDRLHAAKRDPVVKYDQRTAVWTYLHRNRSEEDWLKSSGRRAKSTAARARFSNIAAATDMEVANVEEVVDNGSDTDVDVDDSGSPTAGPHLSSAQLLMQATQTQPKQTLQQKPKGKLIPVSPQKAKAIQSKIANKAPPLAKPSAPQTKPPPTPTTPTPAPLKITPPKTPTPKETSPKQTPQKPEKQIPIKQVNLTAQVAKQASLMAQSAKQASVIAQLTKQTLAKQTTALQKQVNVVKQSVQAPKSVPQVPKPVQAKVQPVAQVVPPLVQKVETPVVKPVPPPVPVPQKSPLLKQRPLVKQPEVPVPVPVSQPIQPPSVIQTVPVTVPPQIPVKQVPQVTRSLLIRPPAPASLAQAVQAQRKGVVRMLSPAAPAAGKSLISPRALMQPGTPTAKKRTIASDNTSVTTIAQTASSPAVVSSAATVVTSPLARTVQLAGGRTVQLAPTQTVHLPGGQAVQLSGHTLQLSSLPYSSVRLPSGQTVQLATPHTIRAVSATTTKPTAPRLQQSSPTVKPQVQIPISSVQLAGQTVQIAGQNVHLTGHTVKLPSGQSVQVASPSVIPSQSVQLPSGQTVQLGQNVLSSQSVQMPSGQTVQLAGQAVQIAGQTVQLPSGQTVQLPSGQTVQFSSGQTVQLSSGQTFQLASGQTVQLGQQMQKPQVSRSQVTEKTAQPIVAKLLTNAQGQMLSLEGATQTAGGRLVANVANMAGVAGVRVLPPARLARPLLLAAGKPLHNILLQQSDGSTIRMTSSGGTATSQIVLSTIGAQTVTTSTTSTPVLKLQQVNHLQQVKLPQGIKLQAHQGATVPTTAVRSVLMDGQQLKLVGGRHVLARILRPAHPPPPQ